MKELPELLDREEPGIERIRGWIETSDKDCEVLPPSPQREALLVQTQLSTRTLRGARKLVLRSPPGRGPGRSDLRRLARRAVSLVSSCHVDGRPADGEEIPGVLLEADERKGA